MLINLTPCLSDKAKHSITCMRTVQPGLSFKDYLLEEVHKFVCEEKINLAFKYSLSVNLLQNQ